MTEPCSGPSDSCQPLPVRLRGAPYNGSVVFGHGGLLCVEHLNNSRRRTMS
jgi:hypothetical protein